MEILFVIIAITTGVVLFGISVFAIIKKRHIDFVEKNSLTLKKLIEINNKYNFYTDFLNCDESNVYDNEKFYDNISCEDYLIYQLQFIKYDIATEIKYAKYNKLKYKTYCDEILEIRRFGKYEVDTRFLNKKYLIKLERLMYDKTMLKPITEFNLKVTLFCSKINGDIYLKKSQLFDGDLVESLISRLNNKRGSFYQDKEIWDALCRVERGKVSNKMRFAIYQRDGYMCKICGRTEMSDYLEIDHIKPIAKGGKSTYDNLQTLCRRCNKRKGDDYWQ